MFGLGGLLSGTNTSAGRAHSSLTPGVCSGEMAAAAESGEAQLRCGTAEGWLPAPTEGWADAPQMHPHPHPKHTRPCSPFLPSQSFCDSHSLDLKSHIRNGPKRGLPWGGLNTTAPVWSQRAFLPTYGASVSLSEPST